MAHALPPHDDHHGPVADGDDIPAHGVVLEEPRSPGWLPYLGATLLACGAVWWLSTPSAAEEARANAAASASASASAAASAPIPPAETAPPRAADPPPQMPPQAIIPPPKGHLPPGVELKVAPTATINPKLKKK